MDGKLFNQMHFPAKSNVIRSRFSLSFSLLLCWLYSCTCSYTHKVQAENLIRRFTNTSPTIRESRGDWLWKTADTKIKKTTTVLQFMLEALWQCTTLCVLFTNGTFQIDAMFLLLEKIKMIGILLNIVHHQVHKNITCNKGVWQAS